MKKKTVDGVSAKVSGPTETAPTTATTSTAAKDATSATSATVITSMNDPAVKESISLLDQIAAHVGETPALNADQIRRATKMRKGGAGIVPQLLALCAQQGVTQIGPLTTKEMSEQLARGDALVQVGKHTGVVQKQVKEAGMNAHGRTWQIATTMYKTLQRMAVDDPELALGLQPVQEFFRTKKTKGKERADAKASEEKALAKETGQTAETPGASVASGAVAAPVASGAAVATAPAQGGAH
jgi:hypothetical protein